MTEPWYTSGSWQLAVILNLIAIRATMFELCTLISGAVVFYLHEIGADDARMIASMAVCGVSLVQYLTEKTRLGRLQKIYDRLEN
jgi:hypothetical protein